MRILGLLIRKEFLQIVRDRATLAQLVLIPFIQLVILSNAATFTVREAEVVVVDRDRSATSRRLIQRLDAGREFHVREVTADAGAGERALLAGAATVVLDIPADFERQLVRARMAPLGVQLNAEQGAVAGLVGGYVQRISADLAGELAREDPGIAGAAPAAPGRMQVSARGWYNAARNYKHYMVPGILVSLITILGTIVTAQNVARERELGTLEQLDVTPLGQGTFILGKLAPAWLTAMGVFMVGLLIARVVFGVPMRGPVPLVIAGAGIYLTVALGVGLLVSTVTRTQQQAMFVSFFILMIYLLMSGLFTPLESMPPWAQRVAAATPVRHYVWVMRTVLVRGGGVAEVWPTLLGLGTAGTAVLLLAARLHRKSAA